MSLFPKPDFGGVASIEVSEPAPGETPIRRSPLSRNGLPTSPMEGINTVADVLPYSARIFGSKSALGYREVVGLVNEERNVTKVVDGRETIAKKTWTYFHLSDFKYISFVGLKAIVDDVARGLVDVGVKRTDVLNIFAATSHHWQIVQHAVIQIGTTIATAYDTLGEAGLTHSLNEPEVAAVFTSADLLDIFSRVLSNTPTVRTVVYDGEAKPQVLEKIKGIREDITLLTLDELRARGKNLAGERRNEVEQQISSRKPTPDDVACIMYTSGTTGNPKGVIIKHSNLVASVAGIKTLLGHHLRGDDTMLHYLPLAHVLEYIVELAFLFLGTTCGYGRARTLTDASVRNCRGDLAAFAPSLIVGVPAVFETIRKGIVSKVDAAGTLSKTVFNAGMTIKKANVPGLTQVVDAVVLKAIRAATGGRLRLTMSGGSALSRETQEFLSAALVTVLQGYGLTESCGMCAILPPEFFGAGKAGAPIPSVEIKLRDVPEAGYFSTNKPCPQGEILIRGPCITTGYYKRPDLNEDRSIFDSTENGGWFHTGDVGQWNPDGTLSVVDRIKNLVKLLGGEYIALERLESTYKSVAVVSNICVVANAQVRAPIAAIFPHEANLRKALNAPHADFAELCATTEARGLVLRETNKAGRSAGFKPMEMLSSVVLTHEEWTPQNGLLTSAQKLQRRKIEDKFKAEIKEAFKVSQTD